MAKIVKEVISELEKIVSTVVSTICDQAQNHQTECSASSHTNWKFFSGDINEWRAFWDLFNIQIHSRHGLSATIKFSSCLNA